MLVPTQTHLPLCHGCLNFHCLHPYASVFPCYRRSFKLSTGLDEASFYSQWTYPYLNNIGFSPLASGLGSFASRKHSLRPAYRCMHATNARIGIIGGRQKAAAGRARGVRLLRLGKRTDSSAQKPKYLQSTYRVSCNAYQGMSYTSR